MSESSLLQRAIALDANSISVIDSFHNEVHRGDVFSAYKVNSAIAASSWIDISFITPATTVIHLKEFGINFSGGICEVVVLESPTTMTMSTAFLSAINRKRSSTHTSAMTIYTNSTYPIGSTATSTQATIIKNIFVGSTGTNSNKSGVGVTPPLLEFVLKPATTYLIRVIDKSAGGFGSLAAYWYEQYSTRT